MLECIGQFLLPVPGPGVVWRYGRSRLLHALQGPPPPAPSQLVYKPSRAEISALRNGGPQQFAFEIRNALYAADSASLSVDRRPKHEKPARDGAGFILQRDTPEKLLFLALRLTGAQRCAKDIAKRRAGIGGTVLGDGFLFFCNFERLDRYRDLARLAIEHGDASVHLFADSKTLGTLIANESVNLTATVTEVVDSLNFEDGQRVKKGEVLATLSATEEEALLIEARATAEEAKKQYDRARQLSASGATAASQLDESRRVYDTAKAGPQDAVPLTQAINEICKSRSA